MSLNASMDYTKKKLERKKLWLEWKVLKNKKDKTIPGIKTFDVTLWTKSYSKWFRLLTWLTLEGSGLFKVFNLFQL